MSDRRIPKVSGPVTGGQRGRPWSLPQADLPSHGYVAEELILEGVAISYRMKSGAEPSSDGRWDAEEDSAAPYRTRILVVRPARTVDFNGTVVVQWQNVTAGYELGNADDDELLSGWAWVGVSAQKVGIDGFPPGAAPYRGRQAPYPALKAWDPERYSELDHPGDAWSYDIFTQAGLAVGPARALDPDPMGGLEVQRVVATGASQSAARLTTYVNAVHPLVGVFDAFVPTITSGRSSPLGPVTDPVQRIGPPTRIRDDIDTPVMVVNSECEATGMYPSRRDDDRHFRFWEVAGAPHVVAVVPATREDGRADNPLTYRPVLSAAYRHVRAWLTDGTAPPVQPRISFTVGPASGAAGSPQIQRDQDGNALGGIRLPEMEAPVAEYHGRDDDADGLGVLYGWARPFKPDQLRSLYPSRDAYVKTWAAAVDRLLSTGALRDEDAETYRTRGVDVAAGLEL